MPIRTDLRMPETLQDMEAAAEDRFWEGWELATQGRYVGALYMLGYVAEMLLKVSAFRFDGASPGDNVAQHLGPARTRGQAHLGHIPYEAGHSVRFWAAYLEHRRMVAGRPLVPQLLLDLQGCTSRIHGCWLVGLRYRSLTLPFVTSPVDFAAELLQLTEDVGWIRNHHIALRS